MTNRTIRELYLPSTGLYTKEAEVIARFLMNNTHLKVLDISNNFIGDRGLESLARGLCTQNEPGVGISALSIFNNQISEKSGPIIGNIIVSYPSSRILDIKHLRLCLFYYFIQSFFLSFLIHYSFVLFYFACSVIGNIL